MHQTIYPDSNVDGDNMGSIWGRQDPGGPHIGPVNFAIWVVLYGVSSEVFDYSTIAKFADIHVINVMTKPGKHY